MTLRVTLVCCASASSAGSFTFPCDDEALDARNQEEARALCGSFRAGSQALVSPLRRAREAAHLLGLDACAAPELRECDHGSWAGRTFEEVLATEADAFEAWTRDPYAAPHGGEPIAAVVRRVAAWLSARTETGRVIAVTHPSVVRAAILSVLEVPLAAYYRMDAAAFHRTELTRDGRRWRLRAMNASCRRE